MFLQVQSSQISHDNLPVKTSIDYSFEEINIYC